MVTPLKLMVLATVMTMSCVAAAKNDELELGATVGLTTIDLGGLEQDVLSAGLRGNKELNRWFSIDVRAVTGVTDDEFVLLDVPITTSLDYSIGAYGMAEYALAKDLTIYGMGGVATTKISLDVGDFAHVGDKTTGFSWGVGASVNIAGDAWLSLDYVTLAQSDVDVDGFNLGVAWTF